MSTTKTRFKLNEVLAVVQKRRGGATLIQIAAGISPTPPMRNVQRWLARLVQDGRVVRLGNSTATRYQAVDDGTGDDVPMASPEGKAIWRLVNQPLAGRMPADYRRIALDTYRPNETFYLPANARTRVGATNPAAPWREPAALQKLTADFVWRCGWLESQLAERSDAVLSQPQVAELLAHPEGLGLNRTAQLAWNEKAALSWLMSDAAGAALTRPTLANLYALLTKGLTRAAPGLAFHLPSAPADGAIELLRNGPVTLLNSAYRAPSDAWLIAACFDRLLGTAAAISDPIEQSFFVFVHLLYLQPFAMLNASMALLAANVPLLRAGLPPLTFATVGGTDLLAGMRGLWELTRLELLRDLYLVASDASRAAYGVAAK